MGKELAASLLLRPGKEGVREGAALGPGLV